MRMFILIYAVIVILFIFYFNLTAFNIFICRPREKYWNPLRTGSFFNYKVMYAITGFFNCLSDCVILMLPIQPIWNLKVALKKKLGILAVFATGVL